MNEAGTVTISVEMYDAFKALEAEVTKLRGGIDQVLVTTNSPMFVPQGYTEPTKQYWYVGKDEFIRGVLEQYNEANLKLTHLQNRIFNMTWRERRQYIKTGMLP